MKWRAIYMVLAAISFLFATGCSDEEVDVAENQRNSIVSYLTSSHDPRLINISDVPNALVQNPPFYERLEYNTFRYIASYYDEGRSGKRALQAGDEVSLTYVAFRFTGGAPSLAGVYDTNDASVQAQLREAGLNTEYWPVEPLKVKIGETNILKGVELSLIGCREGDVVEVYMTIDAAYGDKVVGVVPEETAVAWYYTIDSVVAQ